MPGGARPLLLHCLMGLLVAIAPVGAQEPVGEETEQLIFADDPFETTDPLAAKPGEAELAIIGIYERARQVAYRDTGAIATEIQLGLAPRLELRFGQLGAYGNLQTRGRPANSGATGADSSQGNGAGPAWGGSTRLGLLYQITEELGAVPVVSVLGRVRSVYGPGTPSHEGEVTVLFGKTLGSGARAVGLNLNLGWTTRFAPLPGERPNQYSFTSAVGTGVSRDAVVVLSYARRQQERGERDFSLVEVGVRYRFADNWPVLGFAVGAGTTRDTPALLVSFAAQWSFGAGTR